MPEPKANADTAAEAGAHASKAWALRSPRGLGFACEGCAVRDQSPPPAIFRVLLLLWSRAGADHPAPATGTSSLRFTVASQQHGAVSAVDAPGRWLRGRQGKERSRSRCRGGPLGCLCFGRSPGRHTASRLFPPEPRATKEPPRRQGTRTLRA